MSDKRYSIALPIQVFDILKTSQQGFLRLLLIADSLYQVQVITYKTNLCIY